MTDWNPDTDGINFITYIVPNDMNPLSLKAVSKYVR